MAELLEVDELQRILEPHSPRFSRAVWPAWDRYLAIPEADRLTYDLAAEAKVINRYVIDNIKREFSGVPGIQFLETYGFLLGIDAMPHGIDATVVCRFKKLNDAGESRAYPTDRAKAILRNDNDNLEGLPDRATIVDVGFVFNGLRTGFRDVQVIRVKGTRFVMSFPRGADGTGTMPLPLPLSPTSPAGPRFQIVPRREQSNQG